MKLALSLGVLGGAALALAACTTLPSSPPPTYFQSNAAAPGLPGALAGDATFAYAVTRASMDVDGVVGSLAPFDESARALDDVALAVERLPGGGDPGAATRMHYAARLLRDDAGNPTAERADLRVALDLAAGA
ncbi:MAG TPA: hypothetical protein VHB21_08685, partial [Minicystis sp.]|nr:hypothetical protein [Minicystis sp.]